MIKKKMLALATVTALLMALVPGAVFAANDATDVSGDLGSYYTITAPEPVSLGTLDNESTTTSGVQTLSVETNDATMTTVDIDVKDAVNSGYLTSTVPTSLDSALELSGSGLTAVTLSDTDQSLITAATLSGTGVKTWSVSDLVIAQPPFTMVAAGQYTTTITFTATFS